MHHHAWHTCNLKIEFLLIYIVHVAEHLFFLSWLIAYILIYIFEANKMGYNPVHHISNSANILESPLPQIFVSVCVVFSSNVSTPLLTPTQLGCTNKHSTTEMWSTGLIQIRHMEYHTSVSYWGCAPWAWIRTVYNSVTTLFRANTHYASNCTYIHNSTT